MSSLTLFLIGLAIGSGVALIGGATEYVLHLRRNREPSFGVPGCLVYAAGGLVLAGIVALITSLIVTGRLGPALVMGAGVLSGFYGTFMALVGLWFLLDNLRRERTPQAPLQQDQSVP